MNYLNYSMKLTSQIHGRETALILYMRQVSVPTSMVMKDFEGRIRICGEILVPNEKTFPLLEKNLVMAMKGEDVFMASVYVVFRLPYTMRKVTSNRKLRNLLNGMELMNDVVRLMYCRNEVKFLKNGLGANSGILPLSPKFRTFKLLYEVKTGRI